MKTKRIVQILLVLTLAFGLLAAGTISVSAAAKTPAKVSGVTVPSAKSVKNAVTDTSVLIKWNKAKNAKKYEIQYKKSTDKKWKSKYTTSKKYTVKSLKANTTYSFRVRGINGKKKGTFSKTIKKKTFATPGAVDPDSIYATRRIRDQITLKWDAAKNASWYDIAIYNLDGTYVTNYQSPNEPEYTVEYFKLYPNTWYKFMIRTVNSKTGGYQALKSKWTTYYSCTTQGVRDITAEKDESTGVIKYNFNHEFLIGIDDSLVPTRVNELVFYGGEGEVQDIQYESDYMVCDGINFCNDFDDNDEYNEGLPTVKDKSYFYGYQYDEFGEGDIKEIRVESEVGENGSTGNKQVVITTTENKSFTYVW